MDELKNPEVILSDEFLERIADFIMMKLGVTSNNTSIEDLSDLTLDEYMRQMDG